MRKSLSFLFFMLFFLVSCGPEGSDEESKVSAPQKITYQETNIVLEKNIPLDFMFPEVIGDELSFYSRPLLPRGIVLNKSNGTISGIPLEVAPETVYTIYAENKSGSVSFDITITVNERPVPKISYDQTKYIFTIGDNLNPININTEGANFISFKTLKSLPSGIVIDSETGTISGSPDALILNYTTTVEAKTEDNNSVFTTIAFDIKDIPPSSLFYPSTNLVLKKETEMTPVFPNSSGGQVISYSVSPNLPNGLSLNPQTGEISGTPLSVRVSSNFIITASNSGGSTNTTISIQVQDLPPQGLSYGSNSFTFTKSIELNPIYPSLSGGGIATSFSVSPSLPSGLTFNNNTGEIAGTPLLKQESSNYTVTAINSGGQTSTQFSIFVKDLPPQNLSYDIVSNIYVKNTAILPLNPISEGGDVIAYSINPDLPQGLVFNTTTGQISGTPSVQSEAQSYTVIASNNQGTSSYSFFIAIKDEAPNELSYSSSDLTLVKGSLIPELEPSSEGGNITSFTATPTLPSGLTINKTTGIISGTPSQVIPRTEFTITGSNVTGSVSTKIYLKINDIEPANLSYGLSSYTFDRGIAIPNLLPTNEGGLITNYSVSPSLPDGLSLNIQTGEISGTPNTFIDETEFTITGVNTGGEVSTSINFIINDFPPQDLFYGELPYKLQKNISLGNEGLQPVYSGGQITSFSISPDLPDGLYLDQEDGGIKGTPNVKTSEFIVYTVVGENSGGSTSSTITINVTDQAPIVSYDQENFSFTRLNSVNISPSVSGGEVTEWQIIPSPIYEPGPTVEEYSYNRNSGSESFWYEGLGTQIYWNGEFIELNGVNFVDDFYIDGEWTYYKDSSYTDSHTNFLGTFYYYKIRRVKNDLPVGLDFDKNTGKISGEALENKYYNNNFKVKAKNDGGSVENNILIEVLPIKPEISYDSNSYQFPKEIRTDPNNEETSNYWDEDEERLDDASIIVNVSGGDYIESWSITPNLPDGLEMNSIGNIIGIPTEGTSNITYTVRAENKGGYDEFSFDLRIRDVPPSNLEYLPNSYTFDTADDIFIAAPFNEGGTVKTYSISPSLPSGLEFNTETGEIEKTSTVLGQPSTTYTVTGANDEGSTTTLLTITLVDSPPNNLLYAKDGVYGDAVTFFTFGEPGSFIPTNDGGGIQVYEEIQYYRIDQGPNYANDKEDTIRVNISTVPQGLQFNSSTGELSGTIVKNSTSDNKFYGLDVKGTNDGGITFTYTLIYFNDKPVPNAGQDKEGTVAETIQLNGTNTDVDDSDADWPFETSVGRLHQYEWFLKSKPANSNLTDSSITNRLTDNPSFIPDVIGSYVFELETDDGLAKSAFRDEVVVTVVDVPPSNLTYGSSVHGFDVFLFNVNDSVNLSPSSDGGDVVSYSINKSLPSGLSFNTSTGIISGTISNSFDPEEFIITAENTGGETTKTITLWGNKKPIASINISSDKLEFGNILTLDGSSSLDSDFSFSQNPPYDSVSSEITYSWRIISKPVGSNLSNDDFSDSNEEITTIIPDQKGSYTFGLIVNDGYIDSLEETVTITTAISPKNINYGNIGYGQNNFVLNIGDSLNLTPTFTGDSSLFTISPSLPEGVSLNANTGQITGSGSSYSPLQSYTITASNEGGSSSVSIILWINNQPSLNFQDLIEDLAVSEEYTLSSLNINDIDSSNILNPPFNILNNTYEWKLIAKPMESLISDNDILDKDSVNIKFTPDVEGIYLVELKYNDGLIDSSNIARIELRTENYNKINKPLAKLDSLSLIEEKEINDIITLDMSNSEIYKGTSSFSWSVVYKPETSLNELINSSQAISTFEIDVDGYYIFKGVISDGTDSDSVYKYIYTSGSGTVLTGGNLELNEVLSIENSPYFLDSDMEVINGATLTIEDGVSLIGSNYELRLSNGKFYSSSSTTPIILKNLKINSGDSANTDFEIVNNIIKESSLCEINYNLSSECRGRFVLKESDVINSNVVDSSIGNSIKEITIKDNIFFNSHGFELLSLSTNIIVENNFIYKPQGGRLNLDPYFILVNQINTANTVKVNNNYFSDENIDEYEYIQINNIVSNNLDLKNNNWFNFKDEYEFINWILNVNKAEIYPFATDNFNIRNGLKYKLD